MKILKFWKSLSKSDKLFLLITGILFLITRLLFLTDIPKGIHSDEMSMAYNTWSLTEFGQDRYGHNYPVYFDNVQSGQSTLMVYLTVILCKIFGYSLYLVRLVPVLLGAVLTIFGGLLAKELVDKRFAKITTILLVILPFFIQSQRWAFDCYAILATMVMSMYFLVKAFESQRLKYYVLSGISFGITLYSYVLSWILVPMFLLVSLIYCVITDKLNKKYFLIMVLITTLISLPLLYFIGVLYLGFPEINTELFSIYKASASRTSDVGFALPSLSKVCIVVSQLFTDDFYDFVASSKYWTMYPISIPLFLVGIICIVIDLKNKKKNNLCIKSEIAIVSLAFIVCNLSLIMFSTATNIYRYNAIFYSLVIPIAYAIYCSSRANRLLPKALLIVYSAFFIFFCKYYYVDYEEYSPLKFFDYKLYKVCDNLKEFKNEEMYIDDVGILNPHLGVLYGLKVEPSEIEEPMKNLNSKKPKFLNTCVYLPETLSSNPNAIYVIRDYNDKTYVYRDVWKEDDTVIDKHKEFKEKLDELNIPCIKSNGYYIYTKNEKVLKAF